MKNYQKLAVAVMGILLTASMATVISAHAEEPIPTAPIVPTDPHWNEYELTDINLQVGDTLHLEFASDDKFSMSGTILDEEHHELDNFYEYSDNNKVTFDYTSLETIQSVKINTMVFTDNNAELVNYYVVSKAQVTDVVLLHKYLHGKQTITQEQFTKFDKNHDNQVNIYDFVLLKKELISSSGENINKNQLKAETRIDTTSAVYYPAWKVATSNESYVIKSVQELNEIVTPLFQEGVIRSLENTYDDKFFEDNVLLLDLEPLESDTKFTLEITGCAYNAENQLEVLYQRTPVNAYSGQKIAIGQVAIPKNEYHDNEVIWNSKYSDAKEMNQPIAYECKTDEVSWHVLYGNYNAKENALITTQEELTEFLTQFLDEEIIAEYQETYSNEFFESKSLYLHMSNMDYDDDNTWRVTKTIMQDGSKHINIDFKTYGSGGDVIGCYLNQVIIDKVENDCIVDETNIVLYPRNNFDGKKYYYDLPETYLESKDCKAIVVNIYEFGDNKEIAICKYKIEDWGVVWYDKFELLGSFAYTGDETTFTKEYETDENNNFIGKDFSIHFDEEKIIVNYTGAENPIEVAWN
ncbi:MAG: hypothetical protein K2J88_00995 [Oscillospiraceae bacterium]|nr:hypothetical protein [Oscillospiraceae bacterium]